MRVSYVVYPNGESALVSPDLVRKALEAEGARQNGMTTAEFKALAPVDTPGFDYFYWLLEMTQCSVVQGGRCFSENKNPNSDHINSLLVAIRRTLE